ncbi:MAG: hypothetical protein RLY93_18445 [Sumerlaeia bacterium]
MEGYPNEAIWVWALIFGLFLCVFLYFAGANLLDSPSRAMLIARP